MAGDASQVLAAIAIGYGVAAALSVLLQARQMLARGGSGDVSARFLAAYVGGYAIWLLYGLSLRDVPIIVVDALGLVCGAITLVVALRLRGPLLSPQAGTAVTRPRRLGMRQLRSRSEATPMPVAIAGAKIEISMKKRTPPSPHLSMAERGREAPMVISPLRLARLLVGIVRHARADSRRRSRHD